jgi:hypothetical protein
VGGHGVSACKSDGGGWDAAGSPPGGRKARVLLAGGSYAQDGTDAHRYGKECAGHKFSANERTSSLAK